MAALTPARKNFSEKLKVTTLLHKKHKNWITGCSFVLFASFMCLLCSVSPSVGQSQNLLLVQLHN